MKPSIDMARFAITWVIGTSCAFVSVPGADRAGFGYSSVRGSCARGPTRRCRMSSSARWTIVWSCSPPRWSCRCWSGSTTRTDPTLFGLPVLLLVPVRADPGRRGADRHRLLADQAADRRPRPRTATSDERSDERRRGRGLRLPLPARHRARLRGRPLAPRRGPGQPRRVGPRWPRLRHLHRLVPDRRRHLHGVHLHRGARRRCTPAARSASSRCRTRSWSTR